MRTTEKTGNLVGYSKYFTNKPGYQSYFGTPSRARAWEGGGLDCSSSLLCLEFKSLDERPPHLSSPEHLGNLRKRLDELDIFPATVMELMKDPLAIDGALRDWDERESLGRNDSARNKAALFVSLAKQIAERNLAGEYQHPLMFEDEFAD